MNLRMNVGCGRTPTPGWLNLDGSPSVYIAALHPLGETLHALRLLNKPQIAFVRSIRDSGIRFARATRLPVPDHSAEVVYSSHMFEHLRGEDARLFLKEAKRVLVPDGVLRLVVPDVELIVDTYCKERDADAMVEALHMASSQPRSFSERIVTSITTLAPRIPGYSNHHWMYDRRSLSKRVMEAGFKEVAILAPGETRIHNPEPLDLRERESESLYLEARS